MSEHDLTKWPEGELQRITGILMCERMLYSRPAETEAEIDKKIAALKGEIARRRALTSNEGKP